MNRCVGCGIILQNNNKQDDGYILDPDHKLCKRCFDIKYYNKNKIVKLNKNNYLNNLNKIKEEDLVVYVSSLLTLNLDYIDKFKNVLLVLTKRDILPKSIKDEKIKQYIKKRYKNIIDIIIVSSIKKKNLDILYKTLNNYNKDIYFIGITNSGKSTLINEMIKSYNGTKSEITISNFPETTLDIIDVTLGNKKIKDTPGITIKNSIINYLEDKDIQKINSKKEIKPITLQLSSQGAILVDNLLRIEYKTDKTSITFYTSNNLKIKQINLNNPRLKDYKNLELNLLDKQDLVISDIGFIKCTNKITLKIYYKDNIDVRIRDNLI